MFKKKKKRKKKGGLQRIRSDVKYWLANFKVNKIIFVEKRNVSRLAVALRFQGFYLLIL